MLDELEAELSELYSDSAAARRIVADSGIPSTFIDFEGPIAEAWHRIIKQADARHKLPDLLRVAIRDYPNRAKLHEVRGFLYGASHTKSGEPMNLTPRESTDALARVEQSVNRLTAIIEGTDWGAEGLKAANRRVENKVETLSAEVIALKGEVATLKKNQQFNRWMLIGLFVLYFILTVTLLVSLSGIWKGIG